VYNLNQKKAHQQTSNLYVTIYDKKGNFKEQKILYIEKGIGVGNIKIDTTFLDDEYYIKANTNWMKNFKEDETYLQKIKIIQSKKSTTKPTDLNYDIQFLPESGHMLTSIENTIGVVIKNNQNKGIAIKEGKIIDNKNDVITKYKTNTYGLGSFDFIYETDKNYSAEITFLDDTKISKKILAAENKGVSVTVYNPNTTFVSIIVKTNKNSLPNLIGKEYTLYIHNTSKTIKQPFTFKKETLEYNINLNPKKLASGINIVTVFDHQKRPIAERLFFNYDKNTFKKPLITTSEKQNDSTLITFSKKTNNNQTYYLSASILPEETESYNPKTNIAAKFLITPFIKGQIENPDYYFKNITRKKLMNLDLLLLTQGWSKYNWLDIFNNPPKKTVKHQSGFTIKGSVNSTKRTSAVFLISKENNLLLTSPIIDNNFTFKNLSIKEGSKIGLSTKQGQRIKQNTFNVKYYPIKNTEKITPINIPFSKNKTTEDNLTFNDFIRDDVVSLDGVVIKSKKQTDRKILTITGPSKSYKIDKDSPQNLSILSYIRQIGFNVNATSSGGFTIYNKRNSVSLTETKPTIVYLDNNIIQDESFNSLDQLNYLTLKDFEEVVVSKTAFGSVHLYSNLKTYNKGFRNRFSESTVPIGYAIEKEYYQPQYASYYDSFFKKNGTINWIPKIKIDKDETKKSFKILNLGQKYVHIYLEGITSEGNLILEDQVIELK